MSQNLSNCILQDVGKRCKMLEKVIIGYSPYVDKFWIKFIIEYIWMLYSVIECWGFPGSSAGNGSPCSAGDLGSIPGLERSLKEGMATRSRLYSCLENPQGQRSLTGYSPWGRKESDTTETNQNHSTYLNVVLRQWFSNLSAHKNSSADGKIQ